MTSTLLLTGIGLRAPHYQEFLSKRPSIAWVEVHSENFFGEGGKSLSILESVREHYPISLHGVNLSLGSSDDLNWQHLKKLKDLVNRIDPCLISDHLAWTSINGHYLHDLLPMPYTTESLNHIIPRIQQAQDFLKRPMLIENISNYIAYNHSEMTEWDFLKQITDQSGCGILLDINNIYVSAVNLGYSPYEYINAIPANSVQEIHLAGYSETIINDKTVLIDSHNSLVSNDVWDLYRYAIQKLGRKPTIIEWDADLPAFDTLFMEAYRAEKILRENHVTAKLTG